MATCTQDIQTPANHFPLKAPTSCFFSSSGKRSASGRKTRRTGELESHTHRPRKQLASLGVEHALSQSNQSLGTRRTESSQSTSSSIPKKICWCVESNGIRPAHLLMAAERPFRIVSLQLRLECLVDVLAEGARYGPLLIICACAYECCRCRYAYV